MKKGAFISFASFKLSMEWSRGNGSKLDHSDFSIRHSYSRESGKDGKGVSSDVLGVDIRECLNTSERFKSSSSE